MEPLRLELVHLLNGGQAYETFAEIAGAFRPSERGIVPAGAEHSPWQIVEHINFSLRDLLDYSQNEDGSYREKKWPEEYWPTNTDPNRGQWESALQAIESGIDEFEKVIGDPARDLMAPFPWGEGHTLLREILLAADHIAYHAGQLVELKRWIDAGQA